MRSWLGGKRGGLVAFLAISALVIGGLGWVTAAALRLEHQQMRLEYERLEAQPHAEAQAALSEKVRLAMWRLDSLISPALAKEDSRPYNHYIAVYAPSITLRNDGSPWDPGTVLEPSPLLNADLPDWMLLHFQTDDVSGWGSPQVLTRELTNRLHNQKVSVALTNITPERERLLRQLKDQLPPEILPVLVQQHGDRPTLTDSTLMLANVANPDNNLAQGQGLHNNAAPGQGPYQQSVLPEYQMRNYQQYRFKQEGQAKTQEDNWDVAIGNTLRNGEDWFGSNAPRRVRSEPIVVHLGPMVPTWLKFEEEGERLVLARLVRIGKKQVCQGIVLDWSRLQTLLAGEIADLLPEARIEPMRETIPPHPERTMTALPIELDPGPVAVEGLAKDWSAWQWTPLRVGLALSWAAALVALLAVGLGGWSLIDLSDRRIRFVSAVTHELRTPLTTLRLYLDMLNGGLVKEEAQKAEYLRTLHSETERLNRLVGNVLDFSRLENHRPRLAKTEVTLAGLVEQLRSTWQQRCQDAGKELVVENVLAADATLVTDVQLVEQIVGNLVDNACKYSREAKDPHIWMRVSSGGPQRLHIEVEDRGPGVPARESGSIFRAFRRGRGADTVAGGVGLGLALAQRWARLLGGKLSLRSGTDRGGACFRLEMPVR